MDETKLDAAYSQEQNDDTNTINEEMITAMSERESRLLQVAFTEMLDYFPSQFGHIHRNKDGSRNEGDWERKYDGFSFHFGEHKVPFAKKLAARIFFQPPELGTSQASGSETIETKKTKEKKAERKKLRKQAMGARATMKNREITRSIAYAYIHTTKMPFSKLRGNNDTQEHHSQLKTEAFARYLRCARIKKAMRNMRSDLFKLPPMLVLGIICLDELVKNGVSITLPVIKRMYKRLFDNCKIGIGNEETSRIGRGYIKIFRLSKRKKRQNSQKCWRNEPK